MMRLQRAAVLVVAAVAGALMMCADAAKPRPLEFRLAQHEKADGLVPARVEGRTGFIYLEKRVELDDRDIENAAALKGQFGEPSVQVKLRPSGVRKMRELMRRHQKRTLAILVSGKVVSTPIIMGELVDDLLDIEGAFTAEEARALAASLNTKR